LIIEGANGLSIEFDRRCQINFGQCELIFKEYENEEDIINL
jgi:hypothetical protein